MLISKKLERVPRKRKEGLTQTGPLHEQGDIGQDLFRVACNMGLDLICWKLNLIGALRPTSLLRCGAVGPQWVNSAARRHRR
jgi:hypothetical protein